MRTLKTFLIVIILIKSSLTFSQLTEPIKTDSVKFAPSTKELVLDGIDNEPYWSNERTVDVIYSQPADFGGDEDLSGTFKYFYSAYAFYFYGNIKDDIAHNYSDKAGCCSWTFDNAELFFNIDTSGAHTNGSYAPDGVQLRFSRGGVLADDYIGFGNGEPHKTEGYDNPMLQYSQTETDSGWTLEAEVPWKYILPSGAEPEDLHDYINKFIGFDVSFADSDGTDSLSGQRDAQIAWDEDGDGADEDNAWQDVRKFGILQLLVTTDIEVHAEANQDTVIKEIADEYEIHLNSKYSYGPNLDTLAAYKWTSLNGVEILDSSAKELTVTIQAPIHTDKYSFVLEVTDKEGNKSTDTTNVNFINIVPVAMAGDDQTVLPNETVELDGSGSYKFIGDTLTYSWQSLDGIDLLGDNQIDPAFIAPDIQEDKEYRFTLIVSDGIFESAPDTIVVFLDGYTTVHNTLDQNIQVSPNPASDHILITIDKRKQEDLLVEIYDINGRVLVNEKLLSQRNLISLLNIKYKGVAMVKIKNEYGVSLHSELIVIK